MGNHSREKFHRVLRREHFPIIEIEFKKMSVFCKVKYDLFWNSNLISLGQSVKDIFNMIYIYLSCPLSVFSLDQQTV